MDRIYKIYKDKSTLAIKGELLCAKELNFDAAHPIEAHPIYETELIKKVYWTDGKNQPRVINVEASVLDKGKWDNTTFDFVRNLNLSETVTIVKVPLGNGLFPAGTIQYAFSYFNKYRQLSNIFYTSPLYYNTFTDRAGGPDEVVSNSYNIQITTPDSRFDYVRVYSIIRTSLDGTPVVKRLIDLIINSTNDILKFTDNNTLGDIIDPMELLYIGGELIVVGTMISKDNTLFLGNINLKREEIGSTISLLIKNSTSTNPITFVEKKLYTEESNNSSYNYKPEFVKPINNVTTFKRGEVYRFGIQLLHISGKLSEAILLEDKLVDNIYDLDGELIPPIKFNGDSIEIFGVKCQYTLNSDITEKLRNLGYIKVRGLVVYPSILDRNIVCQGVINPTLYNVGDRATKSPYAISSWYFRPMIKSTIINNYSKGVSLEYRHGQSLPDNSKRNCEIQLITKSLAEFMYSYIPNNTFVNDFSSNYFIDLSIQTFHSPDLEFDENLYLIDDANNLKLRIIGLTALTGFASNSNVTTSTGVRVKENQGWIKPNIGTFNYDNQYGVNAFVSDPCYNDDNGYYAIYPWLATRSLNSAGPSDSRTAMLSKKNLLNYRYSGYNLYIDNIILRTSSINFFNTKETNTIKLKTVSNYSVSDLNYLGNIDKIVVPDKAYHIKCLNTSDIDTYRNTENNDSGNESVRIQYNSSPHLVIPLSWESNVDEIINNVVITNTTNEHLIDQIATEDFTLIKKLTISGHINNEDVDLLRTMTKLLELDLTNATFVNDVTTGYTSYNIHNVTKITLVTNATIGAYMFAGLNLIKITLPSSITKIDTEAFAKCTKLTTILNIPVTLYMFSIKSFYGCTSLKTVIFPNFTQGTDIQGDAFTNCTKLTSVEFNSGSNLSVYSGAFYNCPLLSLIYCKNVITSPSFAKDAFLNFSDMVLVTKDPNYFLNLSLLRSLGYPNIIPETETYPYNKTVTRASDHPLAYYLGTPTYDQWNASIEVNTCIARHIHTLSISGYLNSIDFSYLRSSVKKIEFINWKSVLSSVKLFKNLKVLDLSGITSLLNNTIGTSYLTDMPLTGIILPTAGTNISIQSLAFQNCTKLTSITIPASIGFIQKNAFKGCTSLREIIIADRSTNTNSVYSSLSIDKDAFSGCPIEYIKCLDNILPRVVEYNKDEVPTLIDSSAISTLPLTTIVVPNGARNYLQAETTAMWYNLNIVELGTDLNINNTYKSQCIPPDLGNPTDALIPIQSFWTEENIIAHRPASPYDYTNLTCNGGLWLAEIYRDNMDISNRFGGTTPEALESNIWIPAGPFKSILDGAATIEFLEGDTYIQRYDCLKTYPSNKDDMQTMAETLSFLCETRVNLDARYDTNRGKTGNLLPSPSNFNLMNSVYNQKNNYFNYRTLDYSKFNMDTFPNTFTWTKTKIAGELIDAWTNITMASTLDANGDYGSLKAFKIYNNEIYGFQDNAFFNVIFNSRVMIPTSDNAGIELTNNYKVEGTRYVSTTAGTRNKWGIKETPNGLYFIDDVSKSINVFNGKLNNLTDTLGFHSWVVDSIKDTTSWTPYAYNNFTTHYDCIDNNVYFVNDKHCLCYNETLGTFTSFFSYEGIPFMFNVWDNFIAIGKYLQTSETIDNVEIVTKSFNLWDLNKGDYNVFFGEHRPYYTLIIMNDEPRMDKIFNTLDFRSDTWTIEDSKRVPAIPSNICGFDLLEALNEYLYGKTNLTSEGRNTRDAVRRFRVWRANIPRNNQLGSTYKERMDRMRNTWLYVKLYSDGLNTNETVLHDLVVHYTV